MTKTQSTKRALLMSGLALLMCVSMLIGSTFAWFTDSVTSGTNKIVAGNLDVELYHADKAQPTDTLVNSDTKLFDDVALWEPGAMVWEKLTVKNAGSLALKYSLMVTVSDVSVVNGNSLADVLKVVVLDEAPTRENIKTAATGDLTMFTLNSDKPLAKDQSDVKYVAIYWAPSTNDNDYNVAGEALYANLGVTLMATQYTSESDSFDNQYDASASYDDVPLAKVSVLNKNSVITNSEGKTVLGEDLSVSTNGSLGWGINLGDATSLDTAYQFEPSLSLEDAEESEYADWHADFVVYTNKDVPAYSLALMGYYDAWCQYNDDAWVALTADTPIDAGVQIRLVEMLGATVSYTELSDYGNDGIGFLCGAVELNNDMLAAAGINETTPGLEDGTVLTVELRLYEATDASLDSETDEYIVVSKYEYAF